MKIKLLLVLFIAAAALQVKAQSGFPFDGEVHHFKQQDSINFPKPGGILFIGSSSIRLWDDLETRFVDKPIIKRGLGGSELSQWVKYYMPYVAYPYKPKKVFIYAGENDIAAGKKGTEVAADFKTLWGMIHKELPKTDIYFMAIKPSPSRAKFFNEVDEANKLIKAYIAGKPKTKFVDVATVILNEKTMQPDSALFKPDYLHLNSKGYDKWQAVLAPYVK